MSILLSCRGKYVTELMNRSIKQGHPIFRGEDESVRGGSRSEGYRRSGQLRKDNGSLFGEKGDQLLKLCPELFTRDNHIYHAVVEEELRPLEPLRQLLPDGLLDDPRPREAD